VYFDFSNAAHLDADNLVSGRRRSFLDNAFNNLAGVVIRIHMNPSRSNRNHPLADVANLSHRMLGITFQGGQVDGVSNKLCPRDVPRGTKCLNATASFSVSMLGEDEPLQKIAVSEIKIREAIERGELQEELDMVDQSQVITIEEGDIRSRKIPIMGHVRKRKRGRKPVAIGSTTIAVLFMLFLSYFCRHWCLKLLQSICALSSGWWNTNEPSNGGKLGPKKRNRSHFFRFR